MIEGASIAAEGVGADGGGSSGDEGEGIENSALAQAESNRVKHREDFVRANSSQSPTTRDEEAMLGLLNCAGVADANSKGNARRNAGATNGVADATGEAKPNPMIVDDADWVQTYNSEHGRPFWFNHVTSESSWDPPVDKDDNPVPYEIEGPSDEEGGSSSDEEGSDGKNTNSSLEEAAAADTAAATEEERARTAKEIAAKQAEDDAIAADKKAAETAAAAAAEADAAKIAAEAEAKAKAGAKANADQEKAAANRKSTEEKAAAAAQATMIVEDSDWIRTFNEGMWVSSMPNGDQPALTCNSK